MADTGIASLRGDAMLLAVEFGREKVFGAKGNQLLVDPFRDQIFPTSRQGQRPDGPLARAAIDSVTGASADACGGGAC